MGLFSQDMLMQFSIKTDKKQRKPSLQAAATTVLSNAALLSIFVDNSKSYTM